MCDDKRYGHVTLRYIIVVPYGHNTHIMYAKYTLFVYIGKVNIVIHLCLRCTINNIAFKQVRIKGGRGGHGPGPTTDIKQ